MFCIKSDAITLESIEMYGFETVLMSMYDGPYWVILPMYGSHAMRHTGFPQVDGGQRDPWIWGVTDFRLSLGWFLCHVMACFVALIQTILVADFLVLLGMGFGHV